MILRNCWCHLLLECGSLLMMSLAEPGFDIRNWKHVHWHPHVGKSHYVIDIQFTASRRQLSADLMTHLGLPLDISTFHMTQTWRACPLTNPCKVTAHPGQSGAANGHLCYCHRDPLSRQMGLPESMPTLLSGHCWLKKYKNRLQQRWVYSRSVENCNLRSATMASHMQVPERQGKNAFMERKRNLRRATVNKQSMAFHWLSPAQEGRGCFLLPAGLFCRRRAWERPLLVSWFYFIEVSLCTFFYNLISWPSLSLDIFRITK